jgi:hypothetical protein
MSTAGAIPDGAAANEDVSTGCGSTGTAAEEIGDKENRAA